MARITQLLQVDRRTKKTIKVSVHNTVMYLRIGDITLRLSKEEAKRVNLNLHKGLMIQITKAKQRIEI